MKLSLIACALVLAVVSIECSPVSRKDIDDLSPLNEIRREPTRKPRATTRKPRTTTEDIPEFDRTKVSLDVPPELIGEGFGLITNITQIIGSVIMNSAKRTESVFEVLKPLFRGKFAIIGLPSDRPAPIKLT